MLQSELLKGCLQPEVFLSSYSFSQNPDLVLYPDCLFSQKHPPLKRLDEQSKTASSILNLKAYVIAEEEGTAKNAEKWTSSEDYCSDGFACSIS